MAICRPQGRYAHLNNAIAALEKFCLNEQAALALIALVWREVRERQVHVESVGVSPQSIAQAATAFRPIDDIASRQLRARLP